MWPRPSILHLPSPISHLPCGFARNPTDFIHRELLAGVMEEAVRMRHVERVGSEIFFDDVPRPASQSDTFALPDGVKPDAVMLRKLPARFQLDNVAELFAEMEADELRVSDLAEKANSLAVFAVAVRQAPFLCQLA